MDLFTSANMSENAALAADYISEHWARELDPDTKLTLRQTMDKIWQEAMEDTVYPQWNDIFKAFNTIYPWEVQVVILGQDPYFDGNATGLAFACKQKLSPSLEMIVKAIARNFPDKYSTEGLPAALHPDSTMHLTHLVKQGVMLLNTALTVEAGKPGSHTKFWEPFTIGVIRALSKRQPIWLLWGKHAQSYEKYITGGTILTAEHPAAAARNNRPWVCDHFSQVNKILIEQSKSAILWH